MPFWLLCAFLVLVFLTGGGARADIQSLIVLRPAAIIFCGLGLWLLTAKRVKEHRFLLALGVAIIVLTGAHLVPVPPALWAQLPGREIISDIDRAAGLGPVWRPLAMAPEAAWNAFFSLFVPLAVLLLGIQTTRDDRFKLLPVLLALGLLSGMWGLLQAIGDPRGPLYLYRITNNGAAVGLFSNRNHQAIFLAMLFPMLAVFASAGMKSEDQARIRSWMALAAGAVLIPLLLVTGSRAGLLLAVIGLVAAGIIYRKPQVTTPKKRKVAKFDWRIPAGAFAVLCLGAITVLMSRAEALQRLAAADQVEEQRFVIWGPIAGIVWKYFPAGSGVGSFAQIYQIHEPDTQLRQTYLNHAHNDWLELFLTTGLPGLLLAGIVVISVVRAAWGAFRMPAAERREVQLRRLGAIMIAILALGSIVDYPLRTPSLACVFVVAALWLQGWRGEPAKNAGSS